MNPQKISQIILGTGNYYNIKSGNTVSITGDGGNAWGYYGPSYKKLAPRLLTYQTYAKKYEELLKLKEDALHIKEYFKLREQIENEYIKNYYNTRLKNLNIIDFLNTLENNFGNNIILLCHEPIDEFCHRRILADYLELQTGIYIPEVEVNSSGLTKKLLPIRYKKRIENIIKDSETE